MNFPIAYLKLVVYKYFFGEHSYSIFEVKKVLSIPTNIQPSVHVTFVVDVLEKPIKHL